jgi:hypothetical protein
LEVGFRNFDCAERYSSRPGGRPRRVGDYGRNLVAEDGETPVGSLFVLEAPNRPSIDPFTRSDPYRVNGVWEKVDVHYYNRKR